MPVESTTPDLAAILPLDPYAPRAARFHVREVDSPSPDLRDAVVYDLMLLDCIADRWSIDHSSGRTCMWFEIDRREREGDRQPLEAAPSNSSTSRARL